MPITSPGAGEDMVKRRQTKEARDSGTGGDAGARITSSTTRKLRSPVRK